MLRGTLIERRIGLRPGPGKKNDLRAVMPGKAVEHAAFGTGMIRALDADAITVEFDSCVAHFAFPEVFEKNILRMKSGERDES